MSAVEVHKEVSNLFTWVSDQDNFGIGDLWRDFSEEVLLGKPFKGDCDDFAITCLIVGIVKHGWDKSKCRVARVATEFCDPKHDLDHAVAIYDGMVLDNRQERAVSISYLSNYRFYDYADVPITNWYLYE